LKAIEMWWLNIVIPALMLLAIFGFVLAVRLQTRRLTSKSTRTAEDLYDSYGDSLRKQRQYAQEHGGQWQDDGSQQDPLAKRAMPPSKTRRA
jgi:membrane protein insertase Oxa1/YidC/SpoIIIJ